MYVVRYILTKRSYLIFYLLIPKNVLQTEHMIDWQKEGWASDETLATEHENEHQDSASSSSDNGEEDPSSTDKDDPPIRY